jgi:hypothetical protein
MQSLGSSRDPAGEAEGKGFKIHYESFKVLEEDEIAQVEGIFKHFDYSKK